MKIIGSIALAIAILSSVFLLGVVNSSDAITIDYVGPESSYDFWIWTGATQYSRADCDVPFASVYWYVKKKGETGYGTQEYIDYGDGIRTSSQFTHTFNIGSTSGEEYVITAYVYPYTVGNPIVVDSYTLGVFTPFDEVVTVPNELTIGDDIKLNDYYEFKVDASSSDSNYVITSVEVYVNGSLNTSRSFSDASSASVSGCWFFECECWSNY